MNSVKYISFTVLVLIGYFACATIQAQTGTVAVESIGPLSPVGEDVYILNDGFGEFTYNSQKWYYTNIYPAEQQFGGKFKVTENINMTALAWRLNKSMYPVSNDPNGSPVYPGTAQGWENYSLHILTFTDYNDIEPDNYNDPCHPRFRGSIPVEFENEVGYSGWIVFSLSQPVSLSANGHYGWFLEWDENVPDTVRAFQGAGGTGRTDARVEKTFRRLDGGWTSHGHFPHFAIITGGKWTGCGGIIGGDENGDCQTNFNDFVILGANWMDCNLQNADDCQ